MRAVKVKAIRRAMREELAKGSTEGWIAHPKFYVNVRNEKMLKFNMQYGIMGGKKLVKVAKKIYRMSGMLPR